MKFKYSVVTDNTPEIKEWLDKLGYKQFTYNTDSKYIYTVGRRITPVYGTMGLFPDEDSIYIDCRSKPNLFKILTGIKEDSDYIENNKS